MDKNQKNIKDNFGEFFKEEKREVNELLTGKQDWKKYYHDSSALFKDYFIPHDGNDNRPKILRPKQLTIIAVLLLLLKVSLVGYVFTVYQQEAMMSETTVGQILQLTNESRVAAGVKPLTINSVLNKSAQTKAEDMIAKNYFSHTSPNGFKPWDFVSRSEYPYTLIGENLAMNFIAASDAHTALMASASHKKNILNPKYTDVGLAVISGQIDNQETNILVELFGAKIEPSLTVATKNTEAISTSSEQEKVSILVEPNAPAITQPSAPVKPIIVKADEKPEIDNVIPKETTKPLIKSVPALTNTSSTTTTATEIIPAATTTDPIIETPSEASSTMESTISDEPIYSLLAENQKISRAEQIMKVAKIIYLVLLILLIIALLINIFVRITVQHKKVIIQTLLLIVLIAALVMFDFGFLKHIQSINDIMIIN